MLAMASRAEQKAAARAAREARQRELSASQAKRMRLIWLGGLVLAAALVIVVIAVAAGGGSGSGTKTVGAKTAQAKVAALLKGIPQSGSVQDGIVLGNPKAPVTMTEYGDLVCPICQELAVGGEEQLIRNEVRAGKVQIVYKADETASQSANNGEFVAGQVAARAAGLQKLGWNYILLWYEQQQDETTPYVTPAFLNGLAKQIPTLNMAKWKTELENPNLAGYVTVDERQMNQLVSNQTIPANATPTLLFKGPKGSIPAVQADVPYSDLKVAIKDVS
jgi:protein-disulfide isomerase